MYLDWLKQNQDYYAIDIETDDLNATRIWVLCWENIKTREAGTCTTYDEIREFFERTKEQSKYVGHNIIKFDAPVLNSLLAVGLCIDDLVDTLVLSTLYNPSIPEGHSLDAWGVRMGNEKIKFNDWSKLSDEMILYCKQDVAITASLFRRLVKTLNKIGFSEKSCEIQHKITEILHQQQKNGFYFNGPQAINFYRDLRTIEGRLQDEVRQAFPAKKVPIRSGDVYTKAGDERAIYLRDCERYEIRLSDDGRRYEAFENVSFNLGSPKQRVEKLTELGWVNLPDEVTKKGFPKPFDKNDLVPSLKEFLETHNVPEVALIAKWMAINGRANMVNTWLENWNERDGCIHGKLFVADTLRFRHQAPNTANIPAVRVAKSGEVLRGEQGFYTYEARDLWAARPGRVLVGTDAAGLELRMLAHYLNRADFTEQVVNGDPHQYNADTVGITRPNAKTLLYAIMYGAQGPKVAKTIGCSVKEGILVRQQFLDRLGLTEIMNDAISEQNSGRVFLLDGSGVICPSPHAALNYKLQGGGARVMAQASIFLEGYIRVHGLDCLKVGDIHDEWQYDCEPRDADEHSRLSVKAIRDAGEELNLNVPLDGTAKKGLTWAETH